MLTGKNHFIKLFVLILTLILFSLCSVFLFPKTLDFSYQKEMLVHIVTKIRLPQILISVTAGACLALAGTLMQIILGNPLASPFTLGISSASAFGAAIAIVGFDSGIALLGPKVSAFIFSSLSIIALLFIVSFLGTSQKNIILIGIAENFFFNSANTLIQYYASPDAVYQIAFWTQGSVTNAKLKDSFLLITVLFISFALSLLFSKDLSLIEQGEQSAIMQGVNVNLERILFLLICSLLSSITVSIVGVIGFIGLTAPHISRLLGLETPKHLIFGSTIIGAILLVASDILSKSVLFPTILPISAITSIFGIPFLLILVFANRRKK